MMVRSYLMETICMEFRRHDTNTYRDEDKHKTVGGKTHKTGDGFNRNNKRKHPPDAILLICHSKVS